MICRNCGKEQSSNKRFCSDCGAPLNANIPISNPMPNPATVTANNQSRNLTIALIVVSVVALVIIISLLIFKSNQPVHQNEDDKTVVVTAEPSPTPEDISSPSPTPTQTPEPTPTETPTPSPSPTPSETPEPTPSPTPEPTPEPILSTEELYVGTYYMTQMDTDDEIITIPEGDVYLDIYADKTAYIVSLEVSDYINLEWYDNGDGTIILYAADEEERTEVPASLTGTSLALSGDGATAYFKKMD